MKIKTEKTLLLITVIISLSFSLLIFSCGIECLFNDKTINLFYDLLFLSLGVLCVTISFMFTSKYVSICVKREFINIGYRIDYNTCSICGRSDCSHINAPENENGYNENGYRMGIDYTRNSFDRDFQIHPELQQTEYNRRHDELINRLRELQFQQAALRPPRPIILTTQRNRQPDYRPPDYSNPDCVILNDFAIAKVLVSEDPKPILPKKISNAISTLELTD